ncbi:MAG: hypothetical protein IJV17_07140 [Prevotella sp.]|nr:hypothetical protein [Prevotella sp.]
MRQLINRFLQEKTTQDEEHLIAQMLQRQQEEQNMEQWLTEDETTTYDLIVGQRQAQRRSRRWAVAAVITVILAAGAVILWPQEELSDDHDRIAFEQRMTVRQDTTTVPSSAIINSPSTPVLAQKSTPERTLPKAVAKSPDTIDSLQYYITRLEQELAQVKDSNYTAKAEQIIHADARLQRLVQRIMIGEITKTDESMEAINHIHETEEGQP